MTKFEILKRRAFEAADDGMYEWSVEAINTLVQALDKAFDGLIAADMPREAEAITRVLEELEL